MSRIHYRQTSLDELLQRFQVAVVARLAEPPARNEAVPIAAKTPDGKRCPDFVRHLVRLEVLESLSAAGPAAGSVIEVESANAHAQLRMHTDYYSRGLSRSPIYDRFDGEALVPGVKVIALLRPVSARFAWVTDVSALPLSARKQVEGRK